MKVEAGSSMNAVNSNIGTTRKAADNSVAKTSNYDEPQSKSASSDKEKIEKALKIINMAYKEVNIECKYSIDKRTNTEVVEFVNSDTGETIKQYPPEEILNMITRMYDMYGILLDKKV
jgi:flagellar protein FlaG